MARLMRMSSWSHFWYALPSSYHLLLHVLMTPTRKPYGWVFCPMGGSSLLALVELDHDVGDALGDPGRATHRPGAPTPVELVRRLVDGRLADEERVDVGAVLARVRDRALDDLL